MTLTQEANALMVEVADAVDVVLYNAMAETAKNFISARVYQNVYNVYTPHGKKKYKRRMDNGGLSDTKKYQIDVDRSTHTLTVSDHRPEVEVVESGYGYTWLDADETHIQKFPAQDRPRPYFDDAENDLESDEMVDVILAANLAVLMS